MCNAKFISILLLAFLHSYFNLSLANLSPFFYSFPTIFLVQNSLYGPVPNEVTGVLLWTEMG